MGHNEYSGAHIYTSGRRRGDDLFPLEKITFCFNHPRDPDADSRSWGVGSSKKFEIHGVLKKESRSTGCTSHQADHMVICPK
jgi:hypothetical protein